MKTEQEILTAIAAAEKANAHVLNRERTTIQINAPVSLIQLNATSLLEGLYWCLGKKHPRYICMGGKKNV